MQKDEEEGIMNVHALLLTSIVFSISACSSESLKRTGYETLQNVQQLECQEDVRLECPERESYDSYQNKMKDSEHTE